MELADPELIASLTAIAATRKHISKHATSGSGTPTRILRMKRCRCGECPRCVDNAKWDRIFNEKFADSQYHAPRPVKVGSSLDWQ